MPRRLIDNDPPADVMAAFEAFRETQLGRLLATDTRRLGLERVRDLPPKGQQRHLRAALRGRARSASADDWVHRLDIEAVKL